MSARHLPRLAAVAAAALALAAGTAAVLPAQAALAASPQPAAAHASRALVATLTGGDYLSPTHPMTETLTLVNRTGAAITTPIGRDLFTSSTSSDEQTIQDTDILLQTWQNGHWAAWTDDNLGQLEKGLPAGARASVTVRFQLVGQTMPTRYGHIVLDVVGGVDTAAPGTADTFSLAKVFTVRR
jgi:hypothetical protein